MSVPSSRSLTETLGNTTLLSAAQLAELKGSLQPRFADDRALAKQLLERGWLTTYQLNQVFRGKGAELILGPYLLLERLGEGGSGQVFKARHQHMNRIVALKLIRPELLADREIVGRFQREIQLISSLTHPHVVHAYDAGPVGSNYFLVMEYVEGTDLARLVRQKGQLPAAQACDYLRQAAQGLQHIHEKGLVHRDIKPSNLFIVRRTEGDDAAAYPYGLLKILDLGLARLQRHANGEATRDLTENGAVTLGTLDYMAPEQALDFHGADIRADIYSLGCAFYHVLTGRPPFPDGTVAQKLLRHQQQEPPPVERLCPNLPPALPGLLRKMMAKRPADRFRTPGEIARALGGPTAVQAYLPVPIAGQAPYATALVPAGTPAPQALVVIDGQSRTGKTLNLALQATPAWVKARWKLTLALLGGAAFLFLFVTVLAALWLFRSSDAPRVAGTNPSATAVSATAPNLPAQVFLSDLQEERFEGAAFGKSGFLGHNGNGNIGGPATTGRILIKGQLARKGLSMWAPSGGAASVHYRLHKQFNEFKAGGSLHDGGWFAGSKVAFVVLGDGKVLWQSKPTGNRADFPQECTVRVTGVDDLELQVTISALNEGVWPVWIDPQLTK